MDDIIDAVLFQDLGALDPEDAIQRTGCAFDQASKVFRIKIWDRTYEADPAKQRISVPGGQSHGAYMALFVLHCLMRAQGISLSGQWVSEKDLPSGAAFFRGPHTLPTRMVAQTFENDLEGFNRRCELLGGSPLDMADAAFAFEITPKIPVAVLFWLGDADFTSEVKLLFDRTIALHLPLDIVYALAVQVCCTLSEDG